MDHYKVTKQYEEQQRDQHLKNCTTECPSCGNILSALQGSKDAICKNCGFKIPCCGD
jgi:DNA-directed RNA polymerase subunit RPC12/RpoP